ncbi:MAG: hypothetical protein IPL60_12220 [Ardenticatenia bacterium]|nr:hypothetical protein [Ardenticatenia bacterium]
MISKKAGVSDRPLLMLLAATLLVPLGYLLLWPAVSSLGAARPPVTSGFARPSVSEAGGAADGLAGMSRSDSESADLPDGDAGVRPTPPTALPTPAIVADGSAVATPPLGVKYLDAVERLILEKTNQARGTNGGAGGLPALLVDPGLQTTARVQSDDMLVRGFFDHVNPDGLAPGDRIAIMHRRLVGAVGENIWSGTGYSVDDAEALATLIVDGWMKSAGHRANILRPSYTHLGVGVSVRGDEIRATQNFAEVRGFLRALLPSNVVQGGRIDLSVAAIPDGAPEAEKFDLWSSSRGRAVSNPQPVGAGLIDAPPGTYKLRLYFRSTTLPGASTIYFGPQINVESGS